MKQYKFTGTEEQLIEAGFTQYGFPLTKEYFKINENDFICIGDEVHKYLGSVKNQFDLFEGYKEIELQTEDIQDLITAGIVEEEE